MFRVVMVVAGFGGQVPMAKANGCKWFIVPAVTAQSRLDHSKAGELHEDSAR